MNRSYSWIMVLTLIFICTPLAKRSLHILRLCTIPVRFYTFRHAHWENIPEKSPHIHLPLHLTQPYRLELSSHTHEEKAFSLSTNETSCGDIPSPEDNLSRQPSTQVESNHLLIDK